MPLSKARYKAREMNSIAKERSAIKQTRVNLKFDALECERSNDSFSFISHLYFMKKAKYPNRQRVPN